jgi:hypothetical protein
MLSIEDMGKTKGIRQNRKINKMFSFISVFSVAKIFLVRS